MPLPPIEPRPVPGTPPDNRLCWSLDPDHRVLPVHHVQRYLLDPLTGGEPATSPVATPGTGALAR
ncbi:hypothetical protein ACFWTE_09740 [Nocardiopsis sp. NPDC058631]|uniref:hypothetical protein n=1 Tax=Nocardiopsis sp. NPDC058631 TaxID=3346566 RepID=UPI00365145B1